MSDTLTDIHPSVKARNVEPHLCPDPHRSSQFRIQDYVLPPPSTAAGVVQGRAANGRVDWKTKEGKTLKELQDRQPGD
jgi:Domain of unknown function (DUF4357)